MNLFQNKNQGFTLIETLVAITILMISVVGPLTIASKGVTAAATSKDQVIASYLGQDAMEYIKNVRDSALKNDSAGGWSTFLTSTLNYNGTTNCGGGSTCGIETGPSGIGSTYPQGRFISCTVASNCTIYVDSQYSFYTHNTTSSGHSNTQTKFNRTFTVTQEGITSATSPADAALVTVTVSWKNGTVPDQVVLKSILFNTLR